MRDLARVCYNIQETFVGNAIDNCSLASLVKLPERWTAYGSKYSLVKFWFLARSGAGRAQKVRYYRCEQIFHFVRTFRELIYKGTIRLVISGEGHETTKVIQNSCIILHVLVCDRQTEISEGWRRASKASINVRVYNVSQTAVCVLSKERFEFKSQRSERMYIGLTVGSMCICPHR